MIEEAGKKQEVLDETDDFEFGAKSKEGEYKTTGEKGEDKKGEAGKSEAGKGDASDKDKKAWEGKQDDRKGKEDKKGETGEKGKGEGEEEGDGDKEVDIFGEREGAASKAGESEQKSSFSYKTFGKELGLEIENEDINEFKEKFNSKVESAKQELKLDEYPEEARKVINHLKEGGVVEDFFNNKNIVSLQGILHSDPEEKIYQVRLQELIGAGFDPEKAEEQAEKEVGEMSVKEVRQNSDAIDADAKKLLSAEINKITGDRSVQTEQRKQKELKRIKSETESLKSFVGKQTDFLGISITEKAKQNIIKDIETGVFDNIANKNPETSKFVAYMFSKFNKSILETLKNKEKEQNREGYNKATDKHVGALHKVGEGGNKGSTGHQQSNENQKGKFDGFKDSLGEDEGKG